MSKLFFYGLFLFEATGVFFWMKSDTLFDT